MQNRKTANHDPEAGDNALFSLLSTHPFTYGMPPPMIRKLASAAAEVEFESDQVLFRVGDLTHQFGLLVTGSACLELSTAFFGMTIQILTAGEAFGWSAMLEDSPAVFQFRAREHVKAICFDAKLLNRLCARDRKLAAEVFRRLLEVVAKRVRALELRLEEFAGGNSRRRDGPPARTPSTRGRDDGRTRPFSSEFNPS